MEQPRVFAAKASRLALTGLFGIVVGIVGLIGGGSGALTWLRTGLFPRHLLLTMLTPLFPFVILIGLCMLINAKNGRYRLELSSKRIVVHTLRGELWADWLSLSPFAADERKKTVSAKIVGHHVSANLRNAGELTLSAPLVSMSENELAEQLNAARDSAHGLQAS